MAAIKTYTDISQSKTLSKILPLESADMFYDGVQDLYKEKVYNIPIDGSSITVRTGHTITKKGVKANLLLPCWSLAALLGVIPNYKLSSEHNYHTCTAETNFGKESVGWYDNPIDACVKMIEKLNELKML